MAAKTKADILPVVDVLFSSITGSYTQISNPEDDLLLVHCINTLDQPVNLSFDGGTTDHFLLPAFVGWTFDFRSNDIQYGRLDLQIKHLGTAPTFGRIIFTEVKARYVE